ncbi:hypothetical protein LshimejAT787_0805680 [Lyophyllum shimeji]|uniref:Uncharacterized protein n=1 Tax=Lyophyllum shimeji TaxID=47721 RepID=A0A9P3PST3_LYOSH|nr:hypothetical protein LshimejAT787_0805680 [Lyophyllum shimeji]
MVDAPVTTVHARALAQTPPYAPPECNRNTSYARHPSVTSNTMDMSCFALWHVPAASSVPRYQVANIHLLFDRAWYASAAPLITSSYVTLLDYEYEGTAASASNHNSTCYLY